MSSYTFTALDDPSEAISGGWTTAQGINSAGQVVGSYLDINNNGASVNGYLFSNGIYAPIIDPAGAGSTYAYGINSAGQVVGYYNNSSGAALGFLYSSGSYTTLVDPVAHNFTEPHAINDAGQIVGVYETLNFTYGFLYTNGVYTTLTEPSSVYTFAGVSETGGTYAEGINNRGQIVGYTAAYNGGWEGFLYSNGSYTLLNDPLGTQGTFAYGINDAGQIVGSYVDSNGGTHGFLYSSGVYTTIDNPNPLSPGTTALHDISDNGQIVGAVGTSGGGFSGGGGGFLATPTGQSGPVVTNPTGSQTTLVAPFANSSVEGAGYDILNMSQNAIATASSAYTMTTNDNGTFNLATNGSSDLVSGVIQVEFSDKTVTVAANNSENEYIALLYQGALGRTPDPGGLAYWEQIGKTLPASIQAMGVYGLSDASANYNGSLSLAGGFTNSTEFIAKYGSLTNAQFVTQLYLNVLDRAPDSGGFSYWMSELSSGESREHVLVGFADSAEAISNATAGYTGQSGAHASWLFLT